MLWSLIVLAVVGLIAGLIARALLPGRDPMSVLQTMVLGIIGSFVGGAAGYFLFGADINEGAVQASGLVGSILGAILALMAYRVFAQDRRVLG